MNTAEKLENIADLDRVGMMQMARCKEIDQEIEDAKNQTDRENLKIEKAEMLRRLRQTLAQMEVAFEAIGMHV
jgi:hypothetical protein